MRLYISIIYRINLLFKKYKLNIILYLHDILEKDMDIVIGKYRYSN